MKVEAEKLNESQSQKLNIGAVIGCPSFEININN